MGCGSSKQSSPASVSSNRPTSKSSSSSSSSDASSHKRQKREKKRKNSSEKITDDETNNIGDNNATILITDDSENEKKAQEKNEEDKDNIGEDKKDDAKESNKDETINNVESEKEPVIDTEKVGDNITIEEETAPKESENNTETNFEDNDARQTTNESEILKDEETDIATNEKETTLEDNDANHATNETEILNDEEADITTNEKETTLEDNDARHATNETEILNDEETDITTNEKETTIEEGSKEPENKEGEETAEEVNRELIVPTSADTAAREGDDDGNEIPVDGADDIEDEYDDVYTPIDEEDDDNEIDSDGYATDYLGLMTKSVHFRSNSTNEVKDTRPSVVPGELYTDREFPLKIAIVEGNSGVEWKRPKEFLDNPKLLSGGATLYDIGQGSAGTCWFLSTVSVIADKQEMIDKIVPDTAYNIEDENYDGIFHARFYRFGQWEDIYIDDYLPVVHGNVLWGAKSSTDKNELWVPLLEKAFARLHGSYDAIYGGQPGDAYLQLTGGIGERLELDNHENQSGALFRRIKNAINSGSQVTCVVPTEYDEHLGLVGGHAYSLTRVAQVNKTKLVCVRNPWGHGEWKGPWSDGSAEWSSVTDNELKPAKKDDGEFYVCMKDFIKYFSHTTICSIMPDFDGDGISDSLHYALSIFGEWSKEKNGSFTDLLRNPRYAFTVTEEGMGDDGTVPFVVQIIQYSERRNVAHVSMRCDVFKIHADKTKKNGRICAVEIQGKKNNVYTAELQSSFRHKLKPGKYMLIPSTCDGGVDKAFLLRTFTSAAIKNVKEVPIETTLLSCDKDIEFLHDEKTYSLSFEKTLFGEFISDVNAGGQVSHRDSYFKNPQYLISIPAVGEDVPLVIHIMQEQVEPKYPVGFRLFPLDKGVVPPVDINYLYDKYNNSPSHVEGSQSKFMISWDVDIKYMLPAGRYIGLIHLDLPNTEKIFAVLCKSNTKINIKGFQAGE